MARAIYNSSPEMKTARRAYKLSTRGMLANAAYNRRYRARPNVKQRAKRRTKAQQSALKTYQKNYHARPDVRQRKLANSQTQEAKIKANRRYTARRTSNAGFKLACVLRSRIRIALKCSVATKQAETEALLGCSILELKQHLESLFQAGMSWENHGACGWHIDHKKPCAAFDLTDSKQQFECFHFSNLQPLWAEANLKKGSKNV